MCVYTFPYSDLKGQISEISDIWLIGSRANGTAREDSDWDLLVFSSSSISQTIKEMHQFKRDDIDLLIVEPSGEFATVFGEPKSGSLTEWKWEKISDDRAEYESCKWVDDEPDTEGEFHDGKMIIETMNAYRVC